MDKKRIMQNKKDVVSDTDKLKKELQKLVADFKAVNGWQKGEQDIETSFTFELLKLLGWDKKDWIINTGQDVQTGNKPDIILKSDSSKLLVIESKEASKKDKLDGAYQNKTFTEQLFGYCEAEGLYWGVLTNFVEWRLYAVASKELYYGKKYAFYDLLWDNANKNNYIDLLSDDGLAFLKMLSKSDLAAKNGKIDINPIYYPKQLDLEQDKIKKEFFSKIKNWRAKLKGWISRNYASSYNVDEIDLMSQKILDRMIFMDICHDKGVINENHIEAVLSATKRTYYDELKEKFKLMDEKFNTELFAAHEIDKIKITNEVIALIIKELNDIDFSKLSVHIIGEVYENYLGELAKSRTTDEKKISDKQKQKRKSQGIYYTPDYIVDYIVKNTVGELLAKAKTTAEIEKIRVLDPACGSGSFLIRAFDEFYNAYQRVAKEGGLFAFELRKKILQKNLFGVDLDAKAVEITKLNLMIKALEGVKPEDLKGTHLLPNLNLNIRCGNSLIGGEKLQNQDNTLNLYGDYKTEIDKLAELKISFYKELDDHKKKDLLAEIGKLEEVINKNLNKGLSKYFSNLDKVNPFNYTVAFCEIFKDGGFDAVIGNPPYIRSRNLDIKDREFFADTYKSAFRTFDIYLFFLEKPLELISSRGLISYIIPYSFLNQPYAIKLRELLLENTNIIKILDLTSTKVFQDAQVKNCIVVYQSNRTKSKGSVEILKLLDRNFEKVGEIKQKDFNSNPDYMFKVELLGGAEEIIATIEKDTIPFSKICYISKGIEVYERDSGKTKDEFIVDKPVAKNHKPYLEAKEISRYKLDWRKRYIDYQPQKHCSGKFPELFENSKIIMKRIIGDRGLSCYLDNENYYVENTLICCLLKKDLKVKCEFTNEEIELSRKYDLRFLAGLLNSRLISYYFKIKLGDKLQIYNRSLEILPIKEVKTKDDEKARDKIIILVDEMLKLNKTPESREKNKTRIEAVDYEIDKLVYKLYGLTEGEIKIVEGK